ncbi:MAG: acyl carrier protein [Acidobacteria bacterium]|nr:acyl carrier protein [Acidobacteriota bacterium]
MDDVVQRVIRLIAENQQIDAGTITIDSTFEELGVDSFDGVNLLFAVEGEFDVSVSDEQAKQLRSVRDVVEGVRQLLAAKPGGGESDASE